MAPSSFPLDLLTPLWSQQLAVLILKATLILLAAFGISVVLQRASAGARHLVWLVALGTLLIAPILIAWTPLEIRVLPAADATTMTAAPEARIASRSSSPRTLAASEPAPLSVTRIAPPPASARTWPAIRASVRQGVVAIAALWASGVLLVLGGLGWSLLAVRRIVRDARPLEDPVWRTLLIEAADRLGLDETPRLVVARETQMPFGCGVFVPTVVVPETSSSWSQDRRRAVLLHELAHIRRRDLLGHMLGRIACAAYWFHPLVWMAAKRLRAESERACDDLAVTSGTHAADYAEHLLDIVTAVRAHSTPVAALAMARRNEFEGRMLAILDPELPHTSPSRSQSTLLIAGLVVSASLVAAAAPVRRTTPVAPVGAPKPAARVERQVASGNAPTTDRMGLESRRLAAEPLERRGDHATTMPSAARRLPDRSDVHAEQDRVPQSRTAIAASEVPADSQVNDERPALLAKVLRTDSSAELRRVAAWGLQDYDQSPVAEEALVAAVQHDADAGVREMAAWALANFDGHQEVAAALAAALHADAAEPVRATAAWALGQAGDEGAVEALTAALGDASAAVRLRAAWALGSVGAKHAPPALIGLLHDHDAETRRLAAWALYEIQDPSALPALGTALHAESDKDVQIAELRAIAVMGDQAVDVLRGLLESPDPEIKSMAIHALAGGDATGPWPWPWPEPRPSP